MSTEINMILKPFTEPEKVNVFTPLVANLAAAGHGILGEFAVPTGMKVTAAKTKFQAAARLAGHSARLKTEETGKDGSVILGYILGPKRERKANRDMVELEATEVTAKG